MPESFINGEYTDIFTLSNDSVDAFIALKLISYSCTGTIYYKNKQSENWVERDLATATETIQTYSHPKNFEYVNGHYIIWWESHSTGGHYEHYWSATSLGSTFKKTTIINTSTYSNYPTCLKQLGYYNNKYFCFAQESNSGAFYLWSGTAITSLSKTSAYCGGTSKYIPITFYVNTNSNLVYVLMRYNSSSWYSYSSTNLTSFTNLGNESSVLPASPDKIYFDVANNGWCFFGTSSYQGVYTGTFYKTNTALSSIVQLAPSFVGQALFELKHDQINYLAFYDKVRGFSYVMSLQDKKVHFFPYGAIKSYAEWNGSYKLYLDDKIITI